MNMNMSRLLTSLVVLGVWLAAPPPAGAHRVDEYLQATRIALGIDRIDVEVDLTPGMTVAPEVFRWIDTNGDGRVSPAEREGYADGLFRSVTLSIDGRRVPITLVEIQVPELTDMRLGTGIIRVRATGKISPQWMGRHQVSYSNTHHPESSVYLVNALVPVDSRIEIADQRRDSAQHGLTLEYTVKADARWVSLLMVGLAMAGAFGVSRLPRAAGSGLKTQGSR